MYIALADSSVGDRKQMERLLERESDKRVNTTGVFYIETFGSSDALLSPVVFCISTIDYHNSGELLPNSVFINKPIKVAELSLVLDQILKQKEDNLIPTIEFRDSNESFYLEETDIMYMQGENYTIKIFMPDGRIRTANGFIDNIWNNLVAFDNFFPINNKTIVNASYIKELSGMYAVMKDGTRLKMSLMHIKKIKDNYENKRKDS